MRRIPFLVSGRSRVFEAAAESAQKAAEEEIAKKAAEAEKDKKREAPMISALVDDVCPVRALCGDDFTI